MKATVDLPENLLAEVRAIAERRGWNVRVVFEESLLAFLSQEQLREAPAAFRLAHTIVHGERCPDMTFAQMLEATIPNRFPGQDSGGAE